MLEIEYESTKVNLKVPFSQKDKCARVPGGRWVPKKKSWQYLLTPATAASIKQSFGRLVPDKDAPLLDELSSRLMMARAVKNECTELSIPVSAKTPWKHQLISYNMTKALFGLDTESEYGGGSLVALDMGTGKSKVTVDLICNFPEHLRKVLIICPASVIDVWSGNDERKGQFEIHAVPEAFKRLHLCPVRAHRSTSVEKKTKNAELQRQIALSSGKQFIVIINYESVWREPFASWAKDVGFDLIVGDELHRIKSASGQTSKYFAQLAHSCKYRLGLTGTPLPHSPLDAYGQYRFMDPGIFGISFTRFRADYAIMGGFENKQVVQYRNTDQLHDKMFLIAHRVMSKDVFDLPPFQDIIRTCELSSQERRIYNEMDQEFCVQLEKGEVTASNALVKLLRLQEITSGFLDKLPIGDTKKKLLADVMEDFETQEPLVIICRFTNDLKVVREIALSQGRRYAELSGHENQLSQWQIGNYDVLGVQVKSGREGVDFTRARYSIYYSIGFSLGDYDQSRSRLDRPGQERSGLYIHLLAEKSIDIKVMKALEDRAEIVSSVLNQYHVN